MNRQATLFWLPLAIFIGLATSFLLRLHRPESSNIESRLIGATVPDFALPAATAGVQGLSSADLKGQGPHLVNFFASWCVPCVSEAPVLKRMAADGIPIVGIAIRDRPEAVATFLGRFGNPYQRIGSDQQARIQIDFGSSGVPETFVVDGKGVIRLQIIGPIGSQHMPDIRAALAAK